MDTNKHVESVTPAGREANNTGSCASDHLPCENTAEGVTVVEPPKQDETPAKARSDVKFIFLSGDSDPLEHGSDDRRFFAFSLDEAQDDPVPNNHPAIWPLVMMDMAQRDNIGRNRYGAPLQPFNGRDMLRDAYEEALDLACYLRGAIYERDAA